jgi:hypothetical protein
MDTTLYSDKFMNLSYTKARKRCFELIDKTANIGGHIGVLWHNNTFDFVDYLLWGKLYWDIIKYAKSKGCKVCSLEEMSDIAFYSANSPSEN